MYDDESVWHNKFYKEVTSKVDEDIFKPLYTTEREIVSGVLLNEQ